MLMYVNCMQTDNTFQLAAMLMTLHLLSHLLFSLILSAYTIVELWVFIVQQAAVLSAVVAIAFLPVCHMPVLCHNEWMYDDAIFIGR